MTFETQVQPLTAELGDLDLDVSIVEQGGAAEALLASTDNGCDTLADGDC